MAARSYNLNLINDIGSTLVRTAHRLCHGEWSTEPPAEILPGHIGKWRSQSGGDIPLIGSIGTGTEGWVRYKTTLTVHPSTIGGVATQATEILTVIWNNPFLGDTQASAAAKRVPVPCDDDPAGASAFEPVGDNTGLLEVYEPGVPGPDSLAPGEFADISNVALLYTVPPLFIFGIGKNVAHASTVFAVRAIGAAQQQLQPQFAAAIPIVGVRPVTSADLEAWVGDWTGRSAEGTEIVKISIRRHDGARLAVSVNDLSGYHPATFNVVAAPLAGVTFPHVDDIVTAPSTVAGRHAHMPQPNAVHDQVMRYRPNDPADVARARNWDNARVARTRVGVADRIAVSDHAAIEIYGAFEQGGTNPASWKLRYARWDNSGHTLIDILCDVQRLIK